MGESMHTLDCDTDHISLMDDGYGDMTPEEIKKFKEMVSRGEFISSDPSDCLMHSNDDTKSRFKRLIKLFLKEKK
jgi:hypothetical protein